MQIPTIHPMVVHFPIALLLVSSAAALIYLYGVRRGELQILVWWCMGIGLIGALLAILTGLVDQRQIAPDAPFRPILNWHIGTGLALSVVYGWLFYQRWLFNTERSRRKRGGSTGVLLEHPPARWWLTLVFVTGGLLVIASSWNGGRLVYEWAVNVTLTAP